MIRSEQSTRSTRVAKVRALRSPTRLVIAAVTLGAGLAVATSSGASGASGGWTDANLHVVGGPVVASHMIVVNNVSATHQLELTAINPADGSISWSLPFSQSGTTAGEWISPAVIGSTVIDLAPDGSEANPLTYPEGIDVATGQVLWHYTQPLGVLDAPEACGGNTFFCFTVASGSSSLLVELNATTGVPAHTLAGPYRNVGTLDPGVANTTQLWQTGANAPTLQATSAAGHALWTRRISGIFASTRYSPDYGWNFAVGTSEVIGSVGLAPQGGRDPLGSSLTVAFSTTTGATKWHAPGMYQCMGSLSFLTPDVTCVFTGQGTYTSTNETFKGVTLTLHGLNARTGSTTWKYPVLDVAAVTEAQNLAFVDANHVVVEDAAKKWVVLDARTGTAAPTTPSRLFWCEDLPSYSIVGLTGIPHSNQRISAPVFHGCDARGHALTGAPTSSPGFVGVRVDGLFVWASPHGLDARPAS